MIRALSTFGDLDLCGPLGEMFFRQCNLPGQFNVGQFKKVWASVISSGMGMIFGMFAGDELVGAIGGVKYPDPNDGALVATEMFWFVAPSHRGGGLRLLEMFEDWAKSGGCQRIIMVHLVNGFGDTLAELYKRRGYNATEVHYVREVV